MTQLERATELAITQRTDAQGDVFALAGELDLASAPELQTLLDQLGPDPGGRVLLDLGELSFMDSTGVSLLIQAKQKADAYGHVFAIARPTPQVRRLLELVGLVQRLLVED